jgi:hypothetical protein
LGCIRGWTYEGIVIKKVNNWEMTLTGQRFIDRARRLKKTRLL